MTSGGNIDTPAGTTIGGVNPGTIVIKDSLDSTTDLPAVATTVGDGYIISGKLYVATDTNSPNSTMDFSW